MKFIVQVHVGFELNVVYKMTNTLNFKSLLLWSC